MFKMKGRIGKKIDQIRGYSKFKVERIIKTVELPQKPKQFIIVILNYNISQ